MLVQMSIHIIQLATKFNRRTGCTSLPRATKINQNYPTKRWNSAPLIISELMKVLKRTYFCSKKTSWGRCWDQIGRWTTARHQSRTETSWQHIGNNWTNHWTHSCMTIFLLTLLFFYQKTCLLIKLGIEGFFRASVRRKWTQTVSFQDQTSMIWRYKIESMRYI